MQEIERWVEIKGCNGYFVSTYGRVKGVRFLKDYVTSLSTKGYPVVRIPKYRYSKQLHRVVAEHFIDGDKSLQVNHIDGNKLNNHVSNLEWVTCKENINHAIKLGLRIARANLAQDMFDTSQVKAIKDACINGHGNKPIAAYFKCSDSTISKIRRGKHYAHISI